MAENPMAENRNERNGGASDAETYGNGGTVELTETERETLAAVLRNSFRMKPTASSLYVHRNTLARRICRAKKRTGYDLRSCPDALRLLGRLSPQDARDLAFRVYGDDADGRRRSTGTAKTVENVRK